MIYYELTNHYKRDENFVFDEKKMESSCNNDYAESIIIMN